MTDTHSFINEHQARIQGMLDGLHSTPGPATELSQAEHYALTAAAKRLRPLLVYAAGLGLGASYAQLDKAAMAVELFHTYSLIHDDLPAMDDDDLRRGQPSCHVKFDEATAILAGDALQTAAFDLLAMQNDTLQPQTQLKMLRAVTEAIGDRGMAAGQALDLQATATTLDLHSLKRIHLLKTGKLLGACVLLGALASEQDFDHLQLKQFGEQLGVAFQIQDDILDVEGETSLLGKPQGSDQGLQKSTYPALCSLDESKQEVDRYYHKLNLQLSQMNFDTQYLSCVSQWLAQRNH